MFFESKISSGIARVFSLPPIIAGCFLIYKIPEGVNWGIFSLAFGLAVFGFKYRLYINQDYIKTTIGLYGFVIRSKIMDIKKFSHICLGYINALSINAYATGDTNFDVVFMYKHENMYTAFGIDGFDINAFVPSSLRTLNKHNFDNMSKKILIEISELTKLPVKYTEEVERDYVQK